MDHWGSHEIFRRHFPEASSEELDEYEEEILPGSRLLRMRSIYAHLSDEEFLDRAEKEFPHLLPIPLPAKTGVEEKERYIADVA